MAEILKTPNATIAFEYESGNGTPIVFLHSALSTRNEFVKIREFFSGHPQLLLDFPSHGESTTHRKELTYNDLADDVLAVLDHVAIAQTDIIGYSMGGYIGLQVAHRAPERIRSVVIHAMKFYWTEKAINENWAQAFPEVIRARSERVYSILTSMHELNGFDDTCQMMRSVMENFRRKQLEVAEIQASGIPILISVGDRDELVPLGEVEQLYREIGMNQASLAVHPNSPHQLAKLDLVSFVNGIKYFWKTV